MMCEEMIFEYWFATIRKLSARKKYLLRELIGSGKKIYYIEETDQKMERGSRFCKNAGPAVFFYAAVNAAKNGNCSAGLHTCCIDCNKIQA